MMPASAPAAPVRVEIPPLPSAAPVRMEMPPLAPAAPVRMEMPPLQAAPQARAPAMPAAPPWRLKATRGLRRRSSSPCRSNTPRRSRRRRRPRIGPRRKPRNRPRNPRPAGRAHARGSARAATAAAPMPQAPRPPAAPMARMPDAPMPQGLALPPGTLPADTAAGLQNAISALRGALESRMDGLLWGGRQARPRAGRRGAVPQPVGRGFQHQAGPHAGRAHARGAGRRRRAGLGAQRTGHAPAGAGLGGYVPERRRVCAGRSHRRGQDHHPGEAGRALRRARGRPGRHADDGQFPDRRAGAVADLRPPHGRAHAFGARRRRAASPAGRAGQPQDRADRHHRHQPARSPRGRAGRDAVRRRQDGAPPAGAQRRQPGRHAGRGGARLPQWRGRGRGRLHHHQAGRSSRLGAALDTAIRHRCRSITCRSARRCPSTWSWRARRVDRPRLRHGGARSRALHRARRTWRRCGPRPKTRPSTRRGVALLASAILRPQGGPRRWRRRRIWTTR